MVEGASGEGRYKADWRKEGSVHFILSMQRNIRRDLYNKNHGRLKWHMAVITNFMM